ncbi:MAG: serine/threonine protein kinase [Chitinispirillaceae bacterium]
MAPSRVRYESPIIKLAVERKLISHDQHLKCRELVKKSKRIGLESTIEEVMVKQGFITREQIEELKEISQLGEGGEMYGGYRLRKLIGQGGMGKVYRAVHEFTFRDVAIKILNSTFTKDETTTTRFFQEIRALAKLNHPNIVTLFDAGKGGRRYYFTMELVDGPSLAAYVQENGRLPEKEALRITRGTAEALGFAHKRDIIHRDVKPENILIDGIGTPKVTDFGIVMHRDEDHLTLTREGFMVGTVHFASPEQVEGSREIDGRSDIYSLGATLYWMLTGRTLHRGASAQEVAMRLSSGNWVSPRRYNPRISFRTVRIIKKMMAKKPEKRFQSMDEVIRAIDGENYMYKVFKLAVKLLGGAILVAAGIAAEAFLHVSDLIIR